MLSQLSDADTPNLRWPVNGIKGTLSGKESTQILLHKIEPTERKVGAKAELDKLSVRLVVKQGEKKEPASNDQDQGTGAGDQKSYAAEIQQIREFSGTTADDDSIRAVLMSCSGNVETALGTFIAF